MKIVWLETPWIIIIPIIIVLLLLVVAGIVALIMWKRCYKWNVIPMKGVLSEEDLTLYESRLSSRFSSLEEIEDTPTMYKRQAESVYKCHYGISDSITTNSASKWQLSFVPPIFSPNPSQVTSTVLRSTAPKPQEFFSKDEKDPNIGKDFELLSGKIYEQASTAAMIALRTTTEVEPTSTGNPIAADKITTPSTSAFEDNSISVPDVANDLVPEIASDSVKDVTSDSVSDTGTYNVPDLASSSIQKEKTHCGPLSNSNSGSIIKVYDKKCSPSATDDFVTKTFSVTDKTIFPNYDPAIFADTVVIGNNLTVRNEIDTSSAITTDAASTDASATGNEKSSGLKRNIKGKSSLKRNSTKNENQAKYLRENENDEIQGNLEKDENVSNFMLDRSVMGWSLSSDIESDVLSELDKSLSPEITRKTNDRFQKKINEAYKIVSKMDFSLPENASAEDREKSRLAFHKMVWVVANDNRNELAVHSSGLQ